MPDEPYYNPILKRTMEWVTPEALAARNADLEDFSVRRPYTDALSGLYVSRDARDVGLKAILEDYVSSMKIGDANMRWLNELPRREKGWLHGKRGPTEEAMEQLKEDLIWKRAQVMKARARDAERVAEMEAARRIMED